MFRKGPVGIDPINTIEEGANLAVGLGESAIGLAKRTKLISKQLEAKKDRSENFSDIEIYNESEINISEFDIIKEISTRKNDHYSKDEAYLELLKEAKILNCNSLIITNIFKKNPTAEYKKITKHTYSIDALATNSTTKEERKENEIKQLNNKFLSTEKTALAELKELKELLENDLIDEAEYNLRAIVIKKNLSNQRTCIKNEVGLIEEDIETEKINDDKIRKLFEGENFIELEDFKKYDYQSLKDFFKDKYLKKGFKLTKNINSDNQSILKFQYKESEILLTRKDNSIQLKFTNLRANLFTDTIEKMNKDIFVNKTLKWVSKPGDPGHLKYLPEDYFDYKKGSDVGIPFWLYLFLAFIILIIIIGYNAPN